MISHIQKVREDLRLAQLAVLTLESALRIAENACNHTWDTIYDPDITEGYVIPADPPGMYGVDHRGEQFVPRQVIPRWKRTCTICGKVEYNRSVQEETKVTRKPVF